MYKIHSKDNNTDICYPHNPGKESIWVLEVGRSNPYPLYDTGNMNRDVFVLHYVLTGKCVYQGQIIEGPCVFLMTPDHLQRYVVTDDSPFFEQYWIKFSGPGAQGFLNEAGFLKDPKIYDCPYIYQAFQVFFELSNTNNYVGKDDRFYMLNGLLQLLALHSVHSQKDLKQENYPPYVQTLQEYIHRNYASAINESDLAALVHLSVRYMHRIFKKEIGMPPIQYLNSYRIKCAKKMLTESNLTVAKIAEAVGFPDPNYFSCVFQRYSKNIPPSEYRKRHRQTYQTKGGAEQKAPSGKEFL